MSFASRLTRHPIPYAPERGAEALAHLPRPAAGAAPADRGDGGVVALPGRADRARGRIGCRMRCRTSPRTSWPTLIAEAATLAPADLDSGPAAAQAARGADRGAGRSGRASGRWRSSRRPGPTSPMPACGRAARPCRRRGAARQAARPDRGGRAARRRGDGRARHGQDGGGRAQLFLRHRPDLPVRRRPVRRGRRDGGARGLHPRDPRAWPRR